MPIISASNFTPKWPLKAAHLQTVLPTLFRVVDGVDYFRERITTADDDFIDLDFSLARPGQPGQAAAILCHGLEGSADRAYMRGMARSLNRRGIDAIAYNYRGCSGETNRNPRFYTAGATDDLAEVLAAIRRDRGYSSLFLVGFSLGGNLVLKYLGERGPALESDVKGGAAISVPCDLASSAVEIHKPKNMLYHKRFLRMLFEKVRSKRDRHPWFRDIDLSAIRTLNDFDNRVTAPLHGFRDAADYWRQSSCGQFLPAITVPALVINATDDPILGQACYPFEAARDNPKLFLEIPHWGGHVGFAGQLRDSEYWHESRTAEFLAALV